MADTRVSPLRQRMIDDMTMRNFAPRTQEGYIRAVKAFAAFLGRSPSEASFEDVRRFQLHLVASGAGVPTINGTLTALRFFFTVTLRRPAIVADLPFIREPRTLPGVLSPEEVARLLDAAPGLKYKAALSVAYGAGLRVSEIISLKVTDIDSARMVIRVEQGKGRKDRYAMLSPHLLALLRAWWKAARPQGWLFPGRDPLLPLTTRQLNRACHAAARIAEIDQRVSALTHHPHVHIIVPGGGIALDGHRWIACRPGFCLPVRVLSRLFRRLVLERLVAAHDAGRLQFFGNHSPLTERDAFTADLAPLRKAEWVVYAKRPFGGPEAVLAYLSRYTHRVAIANSRLVAIDDTGVTFRWKDYRAKGRERAKRMTLAIDEFIRRFLLHVLPDGFHRIRHYGLFANGGRAENIARARELLKAPATQNEPDAADGSREDEASMLSYPCPCCGGRMIIIESFERGGAPRQQSTTPTRIDTS